MPVPKEVVLYRASFDGPYRMGILEGARHAIAVLDSRVGMVRKAPGQWVLVYPDSEEEHADTGGLPRNIGTKCFPNAL